MTQIPNCPIHGVPMREWKPGNFSCSVKGQGSGFNQNGYCDQKISPERKGGGKSFGRSPEEQRSIAAQSAFKSACDYYAGRADATPDMIMVLAQRGFKFIAAMMGAQSPAPAQRNPAPQRAVPAGHFDGHNFPDDPGPQDQDIPF